VRVRILNQVWDIKDAADIKPFGLCDHETRKIWIRERQSESERLDTLIHEVLHALAPDADEQSVTRMAKTVSNILWRDKWRRPRKT